MKKSKFSDEQIVTILAEGDRCETTVDKLCVKHGISSATYYQWRKKFHGLQTDDVKRLRELESENSLLKRLLAEREMDLAIVRRTAKKLNLPLKGSIG
jgi:putative transposase